MPKPNSALVALAALACATSAAAQTSPAAAYPLRIPTPDGEVVIPSAGSKQAYDAYRFAAARRSGDTLYVSGVITYRLPTEGKDAEAFKAQTRRTFESLKRTLAAAGASFADVTMINSFHVWTGPNSDLTRDQQFAAFQQVMDEYMDPPWPAWTAVGTSGLLMDEGMVETQLIVRAPAP